MDKVALLFAPLVIGFLPAPAHAQIALEGEVYADADNWRVSIEPLGCILANKPEPLEAEIWVLRTDFGMTDVSIRLPVALDQDARSGPVVMQIDGQSEVLDVTGAGQRLLLTRPPSEGLIAAFRSASEIAIMSGEQSIAEIALAGSDAAYASLLQCAQALPSGPSVPPPAPQ